MQTSFLFFFCLRNCPQFFSDTFVLWYVIPIMTLTCGLWSLYQTLIVVFTGGVGKNGSTVAVSCCVKKTKKKKRMHGRCVFVLFFFRAWKKKGVTNLFYNNTGCLEQCNFHFKEKLNAKKKL